MLTFPVGYMCQTILNRLNHLLHGLMVKDAETESGDPSVVNSGLPRTNLGSKLIKFINY